MTPPILIAANAHISRRQVWKRAAMYRKVGKVGLLIHPLTTRSHFHLKGFPVNHEPFIMRFERLDAGRRYSLPQTGVMHREL